MKKEIIHIANLAKQRKKLIIDRNKKSCSHSIERNDLIAESQLEVELFDTIDSLNLEEFATLLEITELGGFTIPKEASISEQVNLLYLQRDLDLFLIKGLECKSKV
ncbi:MAG: hypothetical protein ACFB02_19485 [Mastigocoleus sp.]